MAEDSLVDAVASISLRELNHDVVRLVAVALTESASRRVSSSSAAAFNPADFAAEQHTRNCAGATEIAAMLQVCRDWRAAICATDEIWARLLQAAFPRLNFDERAASFRRIFVAVQQAQRLNSEPPVTRTPPHSPGASLADFTFVIMARFQRWDENEPVDDLDREVLESSGPIETWAGGISASSLGSRPDTEAPFLGLLQCDAAVCTLSVYVTAPPDAEGRCRTWPLYREGVAEGSDEDCSEMCVPLPWPLSWPQTASLMASDCLSYGLGLPLSAGSRTTPHKSCRTRTTPLV